MVTKVYFQHPTNWHCEFVGLLRDSVYDEIAPALEKLAKKQGYVVNETVLEDGHEDKEGQAIIDFFGDIN